MSNQEQKQTMELTPEELKKKKRKKIIIIICILLIIVAAIVIYFLTRPKGVMTEGNYKQIAEEMEEEVQEGYFETYMNNEWTFPDGNSETTDAILGNSPNNRKPIRCEVKLRSEEHTSELQSR